MPIKIEAHPTATGIFSIGNPNSSTSRAITLPDASTELVGTNTVQTLTNKTINGGTFNSSTINGGTLALGTAVTASGTAVDFTGIPSWVKRVTVMLNGVSISGTSDVIVQLGTSSGVASTGYTSTSTRAGWSASSTAGFVVAIQSAAAAFSGVVKVSTLGSNAWVGETSGALSGGFFHYGGGGGVILSATLDRIRITTANGTDAFDAGTKNIMYEG